jgi:hypothetical protein
VTYYRAGSLEEAVQNIIAESGATQKKADAEIKSQIVQKYGETLSGLASAEELHEIRALFKEWRLLQPPERDQRAVQIIENFRKLQPGTLINPGATNPSSLDNVKYLYSLAIDENFPAVRRDLIQAFKDAKAQ